VDADRSRDVGQADRLSEIAAEKVVDIPHPSRFRSCVSALAVHLPKGFGDRLFDRQGTGGRKGQAGIRREQQFHAARVEGPSGREPTAHASHSS
jgi:hypothetical protein